MSMFDKDPEFDLNDYFKGRCKIELSRMHGASHHESCRTKEEGVGIAQSLPIDMSMYQDRLKEQYDNALLSLEKQIYTVRSMGFEVYAKELTWHNVKDSCYNITGNKGFFYLTFRFVKSQKEINKL